MYTMKIDDFFLDLESFKRPVTMNGPSFKKVCSF